MRLSPAVLLTLVAAIPSVGHAQRDAPLAAPGLKVPASPLPYALDHFQGKPELVPVHHSSVQLNNHKGQNIAGSLAGSVFYKPKATVEVAGAHARTVLHDATPSFFVHLQVDPDAAPDSPDTLTPTFAIVQAFPDKDRRVFAQIRFTALTGDAKRKDGIIDSTTETLSNGWLKITPKAALAPGEYALNPIPKTQNAFSTVVFDFSIDPAAPNAPDAITAAERERSE